MNNEFKFPDVHEQWKFPESSRQVYTGELPALYPSQLVSILMQVYDPWRKKYIPFPFDKRRYLRPIYNGNFKRIVFLAARQCEKSTTLANLGLIHCCIYPHFRVLYVSPTETHSNRFSRDRLEDVISISPRLKRFYSPAVAANVREKGFVTHSRFILRSAYTKPDRVRGIPADMLLIDELAMMVSDHIPIMEECLAHSPYKKRLFAGTPLIPEDAMGHYWLESTQNEWAIPCDRHSPVHYNIIGEKHLGKNGLICDKCGNLIDPAHPDACWVKMSDGDWIGFRIPQPIVPSADWSEIEYKRRKYPYHQFLNEVLALFCDIGARPITKEEVMACCSPSITMKPESLERYRVLAGNFPVYAGIDWGGDVGRSATVLCLGGYFGGNQFKVFYLKKFEGREADPVLQLKLIEDILRRFHVRYVAADYGFGFVQNATLEQALITDDVFYMQCFYAFNPRHKLAFAKGTRRWILHRSQMMGNLFNIMKMKKITFPCWDDFKPFADDILNIISVYEERSHMLRYEHGVDRPDDSFHAILYCLLASFRDVPRADLLGLPEIPYL